MTPPHRNLGSPGGRAIAVEANLGFASDRASLQGAMYRASASLWACLGLLRLLGWRPSVAVEANLGFASDRASLQGPWMALQA